METSQDARGGPSREARKILQQEMVLVPAGEFLMKRTLTHNLGDHVARTEAFWIDKYEVTNAMYEEFIKATGYQPKDQSRFLEHWQGGRVAPGTENQPVRWVDHDDAIAYATWAGKRLPTEEEWEKAGRGTDGRTYPWGNDRDDKRSVHASLDGAAFTPADSDAFPSGVSPYGVFNMEGNIEEWTATMSHPNLKHWVIRKAIGFLWGWAYPLDAGTRSPSVGFRCVKDDLPKESK